MGLSWVTKVICVKLLIDFLGRIIALFGNRYHTVKNNYIEFILHSNKRDILSPSIY